MSDNFYQGGISIKESDTIAFFNLIKEAYPNQLGDWETVQGGNGREYVLPNGMKLCPDLGAAWLEYQIDPIAYENKLIG